MSAGRVPADPPAKNIWCDAKDHAHPRKYLEQNIFSKRGVQVEPEVRYGLRLVRQRLHQATFREAVLTAYGQRCAVSGLPEPRLLDAAHIVADRDEDAGQPVVP